MKTLFTAITLATAAIAGGSANAAPAFQFLAGTSTQAREGFTAAAARWSSLLVDELAIHLGGVDISDIHSMSPDLSPDALARVVARLDIFHPSAQGARQDNLDWTAKDQDNAFFTDDFSIDGGAAKGPPFSNDLLTGTWEDDPFIGLMDPTAGPNDLLAMGAIGWDVPAIPEPSAGAMLAVGLLLGGGRMRRTVRKSKNFRKNKK